jgi:hypothetical protein
MKDATRKQIRFEVINIDVMMILHMLHENEFTWV